MGSLFFWPAPVLLKQGYLVVTGVVTAYMFTFVPEWTTWTLLIAMALYDLYAVLVPGGPLKVPFSTTVQWPLPSRHTNRVTEPESAKAQACQPDVMMIARVIDVPNAHLLKRSLQRVQVLVELAIERDQDIPALIYEGRPTVSSAASLSCTGSMCTFVLSPLLPQGCRTPVCVGIFLLHKHLR